MISEFFIGLATQFVVWLASLFGTWTPPEQLLEATDMLGGVMGGFSGVGVWVEWGVLSACMLAQSITWATVFGIRLIMRVVSHVPLVGGAG